MSAYHKLPKARALWRAIHTPSPTVATTSTSQWWASTVTSSATATATSSILTNTINSLYSSQHLTDAYNSPLVRDALRLIGECFVADGEPCSIRLPDGGVLEVDADGSYRINDKDAKVIYRANRVRDFNAFVNASDKLEAFIRFCGEAGVKQDEMLDIPVKHFIAWLIVEAARADGEQPTTALPDLRPRAPRCASCGRFMTRRHVARKLPVCRSACLERELAAARQEDANAQQGQARARAH